MLADQADNLRRLVSQQSLESGNGSSKHCRLAVLCGSKGGVGVSTLSLNLAVAVRSIVLKVLLVDCHPQRGDLASIYRLRGQYGIDDVLAGRCSVLDAIVSGPIGIQVLPRFGFCEVSTPGRCWQILRSLDALSSSFDQIIVDAGSCVAQAEALFPAADDAIIVTTVDQIALTDSYAFAKSVVARTAVNLHVRKRMSLITNRFQDQNRAIEAEQRIIESCRRFLDLDMKPLGRVPFGPHWDTAVTEGRSVMCVNATSAVSRAVGETVVRLTSQDCPAIRLNSQLVG